MTIMLRKLEKKDASVKYIYQNTNYSKSKKKDAQVASIFNLTVYSLVNSISLLKLYLKIPFLSLRQYYIFLTYLSLAPFCKYFKINLMDADSDDLATDFDRQEKIQINTTELITPKDLDEDDWDGIKFKKSLKNNSERNEFKNQSKEHVHEDQTQPKVLQADRIVFNDKNFITKEEFVDSDNGQPESQQIQHTNSKDSPNEASNVEMPNYQETKAKFEKLEISQDQKAQLHEDTIQAKLQLTLINEGSRPIKQYTSQPQYVSKFSPLFKSSSIQLNQTLDEAQQSKFYFQNLKIIMTEPITSMNSQIVFRLDNIKYCVGFGVGIQEILEKHQYDYKSTTSTEMGHGLYIVTSQGYSWSHSEQEDDDAFRQGFNKLYSGLNVKVKLSGENLLFQWKRGQFSVLVPSRVREKYTLCFCAYLHQKTDSISIVQK